MNDEPIGFTAPKRKPTPYREVAGGLAAAVFIAIMAVILLAGRHKPKGCIWIGSSWNMGGGDLCKPRPCARPSVEPIKGMC